MNLSTKTRKVPGPVVPASLMLFTALSPVRLFFDSLNYIAENAAKYGTFFAMYVGDRTTYVVTDPKLAQEILVTRNAEFHKAAILKHGVGELVGNGLLTSEGDFWKRQRKLAQPAFHHQRIAAYGQTMVAQTQTMLNHWQAGQTYDIAHEMMALTLDIVNKTLFDMDISERATEIGALMYTLLEAANDRFNSYEPVWEKLLHTRRKNEQQALQNLFAIIEEIIAQHSTTDNGDLLSMLLAARDDDGNPMDAKQLRDEVVTLFVAGHETTANALSWVFYLLAQNPAAEAKLIAEVDTLAGRQATVADLANLPYSDWVVKEAMRLYPPASGMARSPIHDIELAGYTIPAGSDIAISTYAMHRDPALFPNPLQFDPERFSPAREGSIVKYSYLPFGGGPRVCIGNSFAMIEARLILLTMLQRFRLQLAPNQKVQAEQLLTTRPRGGLHMQLLAR